MAICAMSTAKGMDFIMKKIGKRTLLLFVVLCLVIPTVPGFIFSATASASGIYDDKINAAIAKTDMILGYATGDMGSGEHQFPVGSTAALEGVKATLTGLLGSDNEAAVTAAIASVNPAVATLLGTNKTSEESLTVEAPQYLMTATTNTSNPGYEAGNAIDGDISSMWHCQWSPSITPFPHYLSLDLGKKYLLDRMVLTPRQDGNSNGRLLSFEIYAGDSIDNLALVTAVTTPNSANPVTVNLSYTYAKVIQIKVLNGQGGYSSIAEINTYTYDRGFVLLCQSYQSALSALKSAAPGDEIGQFKQAAVDQYAAQLDSLYNLDAWAKLNNSGCYSKAAELKAAMEAFLAKVNLYSRDDLLSLIAQGEALLLNVNLNPDDKVILEKYLKDAKDVANASAPPSSKDQIHDAAVLLKAAIDVMGASQAPVFDLSGIWQCKLSGYSATGNVFDQTVRLPGSLDENKKGTRNASIDMARLSRYFKYTGPALFQKQLFIPNSWGAKQVNLIMERTRVTRVWVNGKQINLPNTLDNLMITTAQKYDLTSALIPGAFNDITIEVNNNFSSFSASLPNGSITGGHMATEETQTNWNGIVGDFELRIAPKVSVDDVRVYPNADLKSAKVLVDVKNASGSPYTGALTVSVPGFAGTNAQVTATAGAITTVTVQYAMNGDVKLWDEFEQNMYNLTAELSNGSSKTVSFGMRRYGVDSATKQLTVNNKKMLVRSEANCAVFPLTGYAPMDDAGWERLFSSYKSFGINHVRFHSWCPPDAAFRVADRMGLYLQPELSCWNASNMFNTLVERNYYRAEIEAILKAYANHPSFAQFTFGNELVFGTTSNASLGNMNGTQYADYLIQILKAIDSTRLYSYGSNVRYGNTSYPPTENSDFYTAQSYGTALRGAFSGPSGIIYNDYPSTNFNYDSAVRTLTNLGKAVFSFEVGQFQVFPDVLKEMHEYTGVLEPRNFQATYAKLQEKGISDETIKKWIDVSGMISRIGYREEIEAVVRTTNMSGISLLGIQDFSGQGTALVGMMNALGDAKPYDFANPAEFSQFFAPVVPYAVIQKFSWRSSETFSAELRLANFGPGDLSGLMNYRLTAVDGKVFAEGSLDNRDYPQGTRISAGTVQIPLSGVTKPTQFKFTLIFGNLENSYDIWVYPPYQLDVGDVYIADFLDSTALQVLGEGGKVLLSPSANSTSFPNSVAGQFMNAFWSTMFANGTIGAFMDPKHPVFARFPTEFYSNFQWFPMTKYGRPMILENVKDINGNVIEPLVGVIDGFTSLQRLGLLYEAKVGGGKLVVSSMGLEQLQSQYPEAKALRDSIIDYMTSDEFDPQTEVSVGTINANVKGVERLKTFGGRNVALQANGGVAFLGPNTDNFQTSYDYRYPNRLMEINDGIIDLSVGNRSWTDWNSAGNYPNDATVGIRFDQAYLVNEIDLAFFEDGGCKVPTRITLQYWNGSSYVNVSNQSRTTGFAQGENVITFTPVKTSSIQVVMVHTSRMGLAISEFMVSECVLSAQITISGKLNKATYMISNPTEFNRNVNCIVAVYDKQGRMTYSSAVSRLVETGKVIMLSLPFQNGALAKAFIWDDNFVPVWAATSFKLD